MGGQEAKQPTTPLLSGFPKAKTGTGLCEQSPYCGEGDHLGGCRLSPWVVVCQHPHPTKCGCYQLPRQPFQSNESGRASDTVSVVVHFKQIQNIIKCIFFNKANSYFTYRSFKSKIQNVEFQFGSTVTIHTCPADA